MNGVRSLAPMRGTARRPPARRLTRGQRVAHRVRTGGEAEVFGDPPQLHRIAPRGAVALRALARRRGRQPGICAARPRLASAGGGTCLIVRLG
jgi:hypothetical protein